MAEDLLEKLRGEFRKKKTVAELKTLGGLEVEIDPLSWGSKQLLYEKRLDAWPEIIMKHVRLAGGEPLFEERMNGKKRNVARILRDEVDPRVLQELVELFNEQLESEDVDKGKGN